MDVSEQPHMSRQWVAAGTLIATLFFDLYYIFIFLYDMSNGLKWDFWVNFSMIILICNGFFCLCKMEIWTRRVFSLTRCPIRFNRAQKKIYSIRRRRFFSAVQMGNITWEVPWNEDAIFFAFIKGRKTLSTIIPIISATMK